MAEHLHGCFTVGAEIRDARRLWRQIKASAFTWDTELAAAASRNDYKLSRGRVGVWGHSQETFTEEPNHQKKKNEDQQILTSRKTEKVFAWKLILMRFFNEMTQWC